MSRPEIAAVVFDLDGLMINSEDLFHDVGREVLRRRGQIMTTETLLAMMGRRAPEAIQVMIDRHQLPDTVQELIDETAKVFAMVAETRLETMPGLFALLDAIERRGLPKAVATSSGRNYLDSVLSRFDLHHRFQFTLTAEDVTHGKPHPEIYLTAASRLGVPPSKVLVLEDSHTGSTAAARAGTIVVSIPHEFSRHLDFGHSSHIAPRLDDPLIMTLLEASGAVGQAS